MMARGGFFKADESETVNGATASAAPNLLMPAFNGKPDHLMAI
jgi:hypothetical protein